LTGIRLFGLPKIQAGFLHEAERYSEIFERDARLRYLSCQKQENHWMAAGNTPFPWSFSPMIEVFLIREDLSSVGCEPEIAIGHRPYPSIFINIIRLSIILIPSGDFGCKTRRREKKNVFVALA